MLTRQG